MKTLEAILEVMMLFRKELDDLKDTIVRQDSRIKLLEYGICKYALDG